VRGMFALLFQRFGAFSAGGRRSRLMSSCRESLKGRVWAKVWFMPRRSWRMAVSGLLFPRATESLSVFLSDQTFTSKKLEEIGKTLGIHFTACL